jgi:hypothetical protein
LRFNFRIPFRAGASRVALLIGFCALLQGAPLGAQGPAAGAVDPGSVLNATFTSNVSEGSPVDYRQQFDTTTPAVYYYTEVVGLPGQKVVHRWKLEGKVMQQVEIAIKTARDAVWSKMAMAPDWTGNWTVEVVDARGQVIEVDNFAYTPPL